MGGYSAAVGDGNYGQLADMLTELGFLIAHACLACGAW